MPFCPNCGQPTKQGLNYCVFCGEKLINDFSETQYYCTKCGAILNNQKGFDPNKKTWKCTKCGQGLFGGDVYSGELYPNIMWYCDACGTLLNEQNGFSDRYGIWICTKCGHKNSISEQDIRGRDFSDTGTQQKEQKNDTGDADNDDSQSQDNTVFSERKQVYAGYVKKCPACGEILPALAAKCPACGHEIVSGGRTKALNELIRKLEECDLEIANDERESLNQRGWKSWNPSAKFLWIIFNLIGLGIPLVLYLLLSFIRRFRLAPSEKKKMRVIENYQISNEKGQLIEELTFIQGKIDAFASQKATPENWHWIKIWNTKAKQIEKKTALLLPNDQTIRTVMNSISETVSSTKKTIRSQTVLRIILAIFFLTAVCIAIPIIMQLIKNGFSGAKFSFDISLESIMPTVGPFLLLLLPLLLLFAVIVSHRMKTGMKVFLIILLSLFILGGIANYQMIASRNERLVKSEQEEQEKQLVVDVVAPICSQYGLITDSFDYSSTNEYLYLNVYSSTTDKEIFTEFENQLLPVQKQFGLKRMRVFYMRSDKKPIRLTEYDMFGKTTVTDVETITESLLDCVSEYDLKLKDEYIHGTSLGYEFSTEEDDLNVDKIADSVSIALEGYNYDATVYIKHGTDLAAKISKSKNGEWWHIDVNPIRKDALIICEKNDVTFQKVSSYGFKGIEVYILLETESDDQMDALEKEFSPLLKKYELEDLSIQFRTPDSSLYKRRTIYHDDGTITKG